MERNAAAAPELAPDVEYFQELADGAPVMIWMSGKDLGCFYFNRAWLDYRGRTLAEEFGNGWAEGVHPEDLERCVQHYVSSFERRVAFAMSYRLRHHSGEYRWILDRGAPHYDADGEFLGFFGGCAETPAEVAVERITQLRDALKEMKDFADRVAAKESENAPLYSSGLDSRSSELAAGRSGLECRARKNAADQIGRLAADMLVYDRIANGACLR
jgi:PAS domain S-box-containing protein